MSVYNEQISRLRANPGRIFSEWYLGLGLFRYVGSPGFDHYPGCLVQIRNDPERIAYINGMHDPELTEAIRSDARLPATGAGITVDHIPVFVEWWERINLLKQKSAT